jgi:hypothetical protein
VLIILQTIHVLVFQITWQKYVAMYAKVEVRGTSLGAKKH